MRRSNQPEIVLTEAGVVLGVNLGYDFTAEHEWGIRQLKRDFGITDDIAAFGLIRRKITQRPSTLHWVSYKKDGDKYEGFLFRPYFWDDDTPDSFMSRNSEVRVYKPLKPRVGEKIETLGAAWSESDFAVVSNDPATTAQLKEIFDQFDGLNVVIMLSGRSTPFANSGLVIGIADRLPQDFLDAWFAFDKEQYEIKQEFLATGIEETLKQAKKRYYALSPRRDEKSGELRYWLNPCEQDVNNYGWFTLEDLKLWAVDEGPIPMKKSKPVAH